MSVVETLNDKQKEFSQNILFILNNIAYISNCFYHTTCVFELFS